MSIHGYAVIPKKRGGIRRFCGKITLDKIARMWDNIGVGRAAVRLRRHIITAARLTDSAEYRGEVSAVIPRDQMYADRLGKSCSQNTLALFDIQIV